MTRLIALLDRPSTESMGALPIVTLENGRKLVVRGLADTVPLTQADLDELLKTGQAFGVDVDIELGASQENTVAMWKGARFCAGAEKLGLTTPPMTSPIVFQSSEGKASLANSREVFARLETWIERAFRRAADLREIRVAELMTQVMPDHELTRAALWYTASEEERASELDWVVRVEKDAGRDVELSALEDRYRDLCNHPPMGRARVIALTDRAGSGSSVVAENLKIEIQGSTRSFGQYLRNQWISRKRSEPNQTDLQAYGSEELHRGAFAFVRDVVGRLSPDDEWLIIDGVRHIEVQDIIEYMFDEVVLIGVDAAEEQIQERLRGRSHSADVERIRSHETEQDVPLLLEKAKLTLRADSKLEVSREYLSQLIGTG